MIEITNILDVEKYLDGIQVAVFDLDDTLYSEKEYVKSGYKAIAKEFPQITDMADKLWSIFEKGGKAIDEELMNEGIYSEETKTRCLNIYRTHPPKLRLYAGVREMLIHIHNLGIRLGMVTDGRPEGQYTKINALGIGSMFDKIIVTDELGGIEYRKPNPVAFSRLQTYFNVNNKNMFYVGDNINKDFFASKNANIKFLYFKNKDGLYYKQDIVL